ncbi:MAG TPA: HDOD domain-containing protein [Steroidobacteraceae bacterium]|nr:HDOD domain-containing protein [Steroidobacteraceae bacterium]
MPALPELLRRCGVRTDMKHIVVADADSAVLEALRTDPALGLPDWQVRFVSSAELAMQALDEQPADALVCDLSLATRDGTPLVREVSERYPVAARIALSRGSDADAKPALLPYAHQVVSKPCAGQPLVELIERCLRLRELMSQASLRALVGRIRQLPPRPRIFARLQVLLANEDALPRDVSRIVSADAVITVKVLQLANSAFYRCVRHISNIEQAVIHLGFNRVRNLVLCAEVFARLPSRPGRAVVDLELLQRHAQSVAAVAHALTLRTAWSDDAVLAALLHDIGYWVLVQECPEELQQARDLALARNLSIEHAESAVLGASHAELGAYLLGLWGLPEPVIDAVGHHHHPDRAIPGRFDVLAAVAIACALAGTDDSDVFGAPMPRSSAVGPGYLAQVAAPFSWADAEECAVGCLAALEPHR